AMGHYMNQKGVKTAFLIGQNYAAGKDMLGGVASTFKGKIVGQELTKWPDQLDFSAELAKAKAEKPDAIFVFYPGKAGVQFLSQYAQSGLKGQIPLYTAFTIDELSLPLQKDLALGVPGAQEWVNDLPNDANKKFVADYLKKYPGLRPSFYGAQTYDAANLIASAVAATNGNLSDKTAVQKALEKADFKSVRGKFRFNANHIPIQNFYLQEAVKDADGNFVLKTVATIVEENQDRFVTQCQMKGPPAVGGGGAAAAPPLFVYRKLAIGPRHDAVYRTMPERSAVRLAAVSACCRFDFGLRHHGPGQSCARLALHARRLFCRDLRRVDRQLRVRCGPGACRDVVGRHGGGGHRHAQAIWPRSS